MAAYGLLVWSTLGLVVKDGIVVDAPPYARRWALGRSARELWREGRERGVDVTWIPAEDPTEGLNNEAG